jgi:LPXTG-site transpeptidase (sortase) family protein
MHKQQHQTQQQVQFPPNPQLLYQVGPQEQVSEGKKKSHAWGKIIIVGLFVFLSTFFISNTPHNAISAKREEVVENNRIGRPINLNIPIISVEAKIEPGGLDSEGRMVPPADPHEVSWWALGSRPGEIGTAVLAGHVDTPTSSEGLFYNLNQLQTGDAIYIETTNSEKIRYDVIGSQVYPLDGFPTEAVFGRQDGIYLNLITCSGVFNTDIKDFEERLVVFTRMAE